MGSFLARFWPVSGPFLACLSPAAPQWWPLRAPGVSPSLHPARRGFCCLFAEPHSRPGKAPEWEALLCFQSLGLRESCYSGVPYAQLSASLAVGVAGSLAGLSVGVGAGWGLGRLSASLPVCDVKWTHALPSPSPPLLAPNALGRDTSVCSTGLAGQERRKTAFMGEAFIYSGETKYVKGHCRLEAPAAGEVSAVRARASSLSSKLMAGG